MKMISWSGAGVMLIAAAVLLCLSANQATTQDPAGNPTFGSITLKTGFLPDPSDRELVAGGPVQTAKGGVNAWVAGPPDYRLNYTAGAAPLTIYVKSEGDTTLLINLPDGTWVADDDGDGFPNPKIKFAKPLSGQYDIWVGTVAKGATPKAKLFITELR